MERWSEPLVAHLLYPFYVSFFYRRECASRCIFTGTCDSHAMLRRCSLMPCVTHRMRRMRRYFGVTCGSGSRSPSSFLFRFGQQAARRRAGFRMRPDITCR